MMIEATETEAKKPNATYEQFMARTKSILQQKEFLIPKSLKQLGKELGANTEQLKEKNDFFRTPEIVPTQWGAILKAGKVMAPSGKPLKELTYKRDQIWFSWNPDKPIPQGGKQ